MMQTVLIAISAVGYLATGIFAFFYPADFFALLPEYYGKFNTHFVSDAGLAFGSSGILFSLALFLKKWRFPFCVAGALFIGLHACFHLSMLLRGMIPAEYIWFESGLNIGPALLLAYVAYSARIHS